MKIFWFLGFEIWKQPNLKPNLGARTQKPPKKGHLMDAELVHKSMKIFNLTTRNTIVMKLTTMMYLHEIFSLTKN